MSRIFKGVKVLDFTNNVAGPVSTMMMADFGAEVIKVEKPVYGDDSRGFVPFVEGKSVNFMWHNRGKKSIVLDMKNPKAIEVIKKLVENTDVVVESFRPGVMSRLGLGYEDLKKINKSLIMCSVSAFGQSGPYSKLPGYDLIAQALSGVMDTTGFEDGPPMKVGPSIADYCAGYNAFGGISAALFHKEKTGEGQHIDIALLDCLVAANDYSESAFLGNVATRKGNHHGLVAPYGVFNGKNGSIVIGVLNPKLWSAFCKLIGRPELINEDKYSNPGKRVEFLDEIIDITEDWLHKFEDIKEPADILAKNGIPCAKVNTTADLLYDPQLIDRKMITDLETPDLNCTKVKSRGIHIKFSGTPGVMGLPPKLGQHQGEILRDLNYSYEDIINLQNKEIS